MCFYIDFDVDYDGIVIVSAVDVSVTVASDINVAVALEIAVADDVDKDI